MDEEKPDWWRKNERDRAAVDLPPYEPPRFEDGSYVHEVVSALEAEHDCTVTLLGMNVRYPDDWGVRVDGECAFTVERSRNENGNTVYHVDAPTFRERVERTVS